MKVDMHTHSTASDGEYAPAALVRKAHEIGVEVMAITDHDTIDGLAEGRAQAEKLGMRFINGIEFGTADDRNMHLLGYNFDADSKVMNDACNLLKKSREERKYRIIKYLADKGVPVTEEEVDAKSGGDLTARPHFAMVMVEKGYVSSVKEAFEKYLATDEFQKIERFKYSAAECIRIVHEAGGKAVLAHPKQLGYSYEKLDEALCRLKKAGLDGLECTYTTHTPEEREMFLSLAEKYDLFPTAGSDFHGEHVKPTVFLFAKEIDIDKFF